MKKEKFHIEYIFDKVSRRSLWNHLTTALGLSAWFADEVIINDNLYTFIGLKAGDSVVSMLPLGHVFGMTFDLDRKSVV